MSSVTDKMQALIQGVKATFGDRGEMANIDHPLAKPVAEAEAAIQEMRAMTATQPVEPPPTKILNPDNLVVLIERPLAGDDANVQFAFDDLGVTISVRRGSKAVSAEERTRYDEIAHRFAVVRAGV